ncbi:MAG TPA: polymer-forming cytoskeletal protein [Candidatus Binatia bacterium]|nr:polymer-forming cytoskeletal protein [Candidatus Binatia bacterium]
MALFRKDRDRDVLRSPHADDRRESSERAAETGNSHGTDLERGRSSMATSYASSAEKAPDLNSSQASAFLGRGTRVSGKIIFEGPARIEGQVEGEVAASDSLLVGESAVLNAQISGGTIVIHGKVTGDINASKRLEIRAPGRVYGNVTTPSLVIEEGVVFEGHCSMGAAENRGSKVTLLAKEEKPAAMSPPVPTALKAQGDVK